MDDAAHLRHEAPHIRQSREAVTRHLERRVTGMIRQGITEMTARLKAEQEAN